MNRGRFGASLGTRLFFLIFTFTVVTSVVLVMFVPQAMDEQGRQSIQMRADDVSTLMANAATGGIEVNDNALVNKLLNALSGAPDLVYAVVVKEDGTLFAAWHPEQVPAYAKGPQLESSFFRDGMVHSVAKIHNPAGGSTGTVVLGLSLAKLEQAKREHLLSAGMMAALIFIIGSLFSLGFSRVLTRPLRRMSQVAIEIARGNLARAETLLGGAEVVDRMVGEFGVASEQGEEMLHLARSFATMLRSFRDSTVKLHESTQLLTSSVRNLQTASSEQEASIQRQADTIELTRTTAEQILRNSESAQGRAREFLQAASQAERLGASASSTLERSLTGLTGIRGEVEEIERRIIQLGEQGKRIEEITLAVQSIADHSNVLAVNAAIEAALAGEQGKGFAVVAREFRDLANQSLRETEMVRNILADIRRATLSTIELTSAGARKIDQGLSEVRSSSETLRELSRMVVDSSRAMGEITSTVQQQNSEILQIFENVSALSKLMDSTIEQVGVTGDAVKVIDSVSQTVAGVAGRYEI